MTRTRFAYCPSNWSRSAYPRPRAEHVSNFGVHILDDFLPDLEAASLLRYATGLAYETATTLSPESETPVVAAGYRRGLISYPEGEPVEAFVDHARRTVLSLMDANGKVTYTNEIDLHLIASRHGDYFRPHNDNGHKSLAAREFTYVYYMHSQPRRFAGGELRIYPGTSVDAIRTAPIATIEPDNNRLVVFPSGLIHEASPVYAPELAQANLRFALSGWVSRVTAPDRVASD